MKLLQSLVAVVTLASAALPQVEACTTTIIHHAATVSGATLIAHSNDGDGDVAGAIVAVPRGKGTNAYYTKPGGYASMNEHGLTLAESTCSGIKFNCSATNGGTNIVALSELCLATSATARECVANMGKAATEQGYNDNAESLLIADAVGEAFIFHILADDTGKSAIWVAEPIRQGGVAVVSNAFTIREIRADVHIFSRNIFSVAERNGLWENGTALDFSHVYGVDESVKYACGRRMWRGFALLAGSDLGSDYAGRIPYPSQVPAMRNVSLDNVKSFMRDYYYNTPFATNAGLAAGPFLSPSRFRDSSDADKDCTLRGKALVPYERTVATWKTIVGYVGRVHVGNPSGCELWFAPHNALTSVYVPFLSGSLASDSPIDAIIPEAYSNSSLSAFSRGKHSAWMASYFVFMTAQSSFACAIKLIAQKQRELESKSEEVVATKPDVASLVSNAESNVEEWWNLSDQIILAGSDCQYGASWILSTKRCA